MHSLIKKSLIIILLSSISFASTDNLYTCNFNGKATTYHQNEAKRMILMGADCRTMHSQEHITCAMDGVRVDYSRKEAEDLLYLYPKAHCEINNQLFLASSHSNKGLTMEKKIIVYFPVNGTALSYQNRQKLSTFARQHRNMGYNYTITGYASATGNATKNHTLSLQRAGIVHTALLNYGIATDNILSIDALGEASLRYQTSYEFRLNRAVVIKAYK